MLQIEDDANLIFFNQVTTVSGRERAMEVYPSSSSGLKITVTPPQASAGTQVDSGNPKMRSPVLVLSPPNLDPNVIAGRNFAHENN